jgi:malonate-semialdehyde dehydrogenase (acetylating) / methylmalonate-semialdehyde dehydrogenase
MSEKVLNYINGEWRESKAVETLDVINPATLEWLAQTPLSHAGEVDEAVQAASDVLPAWRRTPAGDRIQPLFKLKTLLEQNYDDIACTITMECGKTLDEARGEVKRAIENLEVASGIPMMMQGVISEDIAPGIDEIMLRQPVGVAAAICPFNFPGMIAFWFMPYALACGNTYLVKPSEKVPLTMQKIFHLVEQAGFPKGVVNMVNGAKEAVDAILDHPLVRAVSFVGSTATARYIYLKSAQNGKRVQAQGGAKTPVVILPDADMEAAVKIIADSGYGCAGQRCLATSLVFTVGEAHKPFTEALAEAARVRVTGYGLELGVQMGPVINQASKERIESLIQKGIDEGAKALVDGRGAVVPKYDKGFFVKPTVLDGLPLNGEIAKTEIFGPVLGVIHFDSLDEAVAAINSAKYGNQASIFTLSGSSARKVRYEAEVGNVGINIGIAAPMAHFPFSGWKESFFGDLHGQGMDAVDFFTQKKVIVERWPKEWTRKF